MIVLQEHVVKRCREYGKQSVRRGSHKNAYSYRGAENDPALLAASKAAECICAEHFGLDVFSAVNFEIGQPDAGADVVVGLVSVDVKAIDPHDNYLLWPLRKNKIYAGKKFNVMVLVEVCEAQGECVGWMGKAEFFRRKRVADETSRLDVGTWHLHREQLHRMGVFPGRPFDGVSPFEHYCRCGEWGSFGYESPQPKELHGWYCKEHRPS
jgi:hypothetical protein